jgi:aspartate kinase
MVAATEEGRRVVAVVSAMGRSTDELSDLAYSISSQPSLRELDALLSVGERISCALTSMAVHDLGKQAVSLTGAQAGIVTDAHYGNARLSNIDPRRVLAALEEHEVVLVTGFQGVSAAGEVTTLGRGGSDASAVALASALGLSECEIFTDVPAVFTADPRVVSDAQQLPTLSHQEMLELAEAGAGVLQPRAVELAATHGIDIHLRSSFTAESGTWIRRATRTFEDTSVSGIGSRRHETLYAARGVTAAAVSEALAQRGVSVGAISRESDEILFTAPGASSQEVAAALEAAGAVAAVREDLGSVGVVSLGIARKPDVTARALALLAAAGVEPRLLTTTPNRISCLIPEAAVDDAVGLLHHALIARAGDGLAGRPAPDPGARLSPLAPAPPVRSSAPQPRRVGRPRTRGAAGERDAS